DSGGSPAGRMRCVIFLLPRYFLINAPSREYSCIGHARSFGLKYACATACATPAPASSAP
ncbi:MAG: hypothetical protein IKT21_03050, partial [Methanomicrobium sp.]|nr:hypothetical protein [Methanomicrobium sp.]